MRGEHLVGLVDRQTRPFGDHLQILVGHDGGDLDDDGRCRA